jgi:hypothetical protein
VIPGGFGARVGVGLGVFVDVGKGFEVGVIVCDGMLVGVRETVGLLVIVCMGIVGIAVGDIRIVGVNIFGISPLGAFCTVLIRLINMTAMIITAMNMKMPAKSLIIPVGVDFFGGLFGEIIGSGVF